MSLSERFSEAFYREFTLTVLKMCLRGSFFVSLRNQAEFFYNQGKR